MHLAEWLAFGVVFVAGLYWWRRIATHLDVVETRLKSIDEALEKQRKG